MQPQERARRIPRQQRVAVAAEADQAVGELRQLSGAISTVPKRELSIVNGTPSVTLGS